LGLEDRPLSGEGPWSRRDHHLDDRRCYLRRCYDNYCADDDNNCAYDDDSCSDNNNNCAYDDDSCSDDDNYCVDNHYQGNLRLTRTFTSKEPPARGRPKRLAPRFASRLEAGTAVAFGTTRERAHARSVATVVR